MTQLRAGIAALAAVGLSSLLTGCAHGSAEAPLLLELERSHAQAAEERARVAELELRLGRLEQRPRTDSNSWRVADKLDRLISLQRQLLERVEQAQDKDSSSPTRSNGVGDDEESFEEQLGRLLERLRSEPPPWHGGLSREKREALRVLMRQDRALDTQNPLVP
jgi:hypothetical protein